MTRQPAPRSQKVTNDGAKCQLDDWYNRLCFASSSRVQEDWGGEEEDRGDMLEFGGRVAGQVVRLVKHYLGSTFRSYRIISSTDPELATLTLSSLFT